MNQNINFMKFSDICQTYKPHGNKLGKEVFIKMRDYVEKHRLQTCFEISFTDITFADSSFARESIVLLAQVYRGKKGFILTDLYDEDVIDNIDYAAVALDQPLALRLEDGIRLLGPTLTKSNLEIYEILKIKKKVTTSQLASLMDLSVQNASSKLKKLVDEGYILRFEETADTGGIEFIYQIIG
ncbi:helix-turn-helix transcriptional regulator [Acinetobacter radioresistens]|nr:helix-turn-helix transcriptional regulator [Acinetobacter radioresistens]